VCFFSICWHISKGTRLHVYYG